MKTTHYERQALGSLNLAPSARSPSEKQFSYFDELVRED